MVAPLTVLVVDDHELLRTGTRRILEEAEGIRVVGEAADGSTALRIVRQHRPDVVLVDIRLTDGNGIDLARRILATDSPPAVVVLTAYDDEHYVQASLAAGVSGYLLKTLPAGELVRTVRAIRDGTTDGVPVPRSNGDALHGGPSWHHLTEREREVVRLVAQGMANKQIARRLGISPRTVEGHLNHVFDKVGAGSRTELVQIALANGLLTAGRPRPTGATADERGLSRRPG